VDLNAPALVAAGAASVAVYAHGVIGHRWFTAQLRSVELPGSRLFGDPDVSWRVFAVTWHVVTAAFAVSAAALYLTAFEAVESRDLLRFVAIMHAAFLGVGSIFLGPRLDLLARPIPPLFVSCMATVAVLGWIASNSA
jgi:hypothetical protein